MYLIKHRIMNFFTVCYQKTTSTGNMFHRGKEISVLLQMWFGIFLLFFVFLTTKKKTHFLNGVCNVLL